MKKIYRKEQYGQDGKQQCGYGEQQLASFYGVGVVVIEFTERDIQPEIQYYRYRDDDGEDIIIETVFFLGHQPEVDGQEQDA